jgi:excisionase family DNA binding protein
MATQPAGELGPGGNGSADPEPVWDSNQAARFLRLHPKTVKRMAQTGQIPGCRLGRRWFFRPSELDGLLRSKVSSSPKTNNLRRNSSERS